MERVWREAAPNHAASHGLLAEGGPLLAEEVRDGELLIAIIVRNDFTSDGVTVFTPSEFSQQLAFMRHSRGKVISPPVHNPVLRRSVTHRRGAPHTEARLRVGLKLTTKPASRGACFGQRRDSARRRRQGPYSGHAEKTRFEGVTEAHLRVVRDGVSGNQGAFQLTSHCSTGASCGI